MCPKEGGRNTLLEMGKNYSQVMRWVRSTMALSISHMYCSRDQGFIEGVEGPGFDDGVGMPMYVQHRLLTAT